MRILKPMFFKSGLIPVVFGIWILCVANCPMGAKAQSADRALESIAESNSTLADEQTNIAPISANYKQVQRRLARGWNTWDLNSVTTQVLLPEGLTIHLGLKHNDAHGPNVFLQDALIGRRNPSAEQVIPGPHSWDGSYSELRISWMGHVWRVQSAHDGTDLVLLATPLPSTPKPALPPTLVVSVDFLWNLSGTSMRLPNSIETRGVSGDVPVYCTCAQLLDKPAQQVFDIPIGGPYFSVDFTAPVGVSTGKRRTLAEVEAIIKREKEAYQQSIADAGENGPILDAIETTLGWDTIYDPSHHRVISPVSRVWSVDRGGYALFDWDIFFASILAATGDRDLAYANAIEILREETPQGFVPNAARPGGWNSSDRSEPPVGAITVLDLYKQFHDRWFLEDTFVPLLRWNRWWSEHREIQGYLAWGSDGGQQPVNPSDRARGTRTGAVLESGLDNSPMYDAAVYNPQSHLLEFADVGLMSMYIADCDALAEIADTLGRTKEAKELRDRGIRYRDKLQTMWSDQAGMFLNKDLHAGQFSTRLSPTNFYPMLAKVATAEQAKVMVENHMLSPQEFWGEWVIPSIARNDPAFHDQNYWRGRIWGPMNYLVYLGLLNYDFPVVRREFAQKSYSLFLKEWTEKGHVHENYNAISGEGDDVQNSDRFYHWGALLGYVECLEQSQTAGKH